MEYINFYTISIGLLVILIPLFIWMWKKHKYNSRDVAADLVNASIAPYNPSDPKFNKIAHTNSIIGLTLGIAFFLIDLLAGFPRITDGSTAGGRGFYILLILWSSYVLLRDYRDKRKPPQT